MFVLKAARAKALDDIDNALKAKEAAAQKAAEEAKAAEAKAKQEQAERQKLENSIATGWDKSDVNIVGQDELTNNFGGSPKGVEFVGIVE